MANPKTIAIIHNPVLENAAVDERDVLEQVNVIAETLPLLDFKPAILAFSPDLEKMKQALLSLKPYCIFNLVEAVDGDAQLLHLAPALYDHLRMPYTGASTYAMFVTTHKVLAKKWMTLTHVPTAEWLSLENHPLCSPTFPERYIIKPISEEASVGLDATAIVEVQGREELAQRVRDRQRLIGKACFAERYIEGREFNLSLLGCPDGVTVMPPAEMNFNYPDGMPKIMDYKAKWLNGTPEYDNTQRTFDLPLADRDLVERLRQVAIQCWNLFHLQGYARVDFRVDLKGQVFVLEINANPCLSVGSGFPAACEKSGLTYADMLRRIIEEALNMFKVY